MIDPKEPTRSRRTTGLNQPNPDQHHLDAGTVTHIHLNQHATMPVTQMLGQPGIQHHLQNIPS